MSPEQAATPKQMKATDKPYADSAAWMLFVLQNLFASLTDDLADIHFQNVPNPKQGVESGVPRICFQTANQRLAQSCFFRKHVAGKPLPLPFLDKEPHNFSTHFVSMAVF
jgi:hypothetical protein